MAAGKLLIKAFTPTPTGSLLLLTVLLTPLRQQLAKFTYTRLFIIFLLFINRGSFPLRWHFKLAWIGLKARLNFELAKRGYKKPSTQQIELGLRKEELSFEQIGRSPFDIVTVRHTRVSFAESDYNLHLSNSNYAQAGDFARMQYASNYIGVAYAQDRIMTLLGGTSFVYLREIPMFITYTTESRTVAWDDKWCYFMTRFIIPYDKTSKRAPSKSFATGEDCTVCAYLLSRLCFKRGRTSVSPEKVLALSGCAGSEDLAIEPLKNWKMAKGIRRSKKINEFIKDESDNGIYLKGTEDRNKRALEIIGKLHDSDRSPWTQLDELR